MKKKKSTSAGSTSHEAERGKIRQHSAYSGERGWIGFFMTSLAVLSFCGAVLAGFFMLFALAFYLAASGCMFLVGGAVIGALFDIADSSLAARRDEAARIAREALAEARRREAAFQDMQGE